MNKPTTASILAAVTLETGVTLAQITGGKHEREIVTARRLAVWLLRQLRGMSQSQIGKVVGGQNNSTICVSLQSMKQRLELEPELRDAAARIITRLDKPQPLTIDPAQRENALVELVAQLRKTTDRLHAESSELADLAAALLPYAQRKGE